MARILAHAHTDWSHDGTFTLADWVPMARRIGCDTVLLSEHEETGWTPGRYADYVKACAEASTAEVRLVPGIEFSQDGFHVLCYGLREFPARPSTPEQLAAAVHAQGRWLCLAHPGKYGWRHPARLLAAVDAVEVWNSKWIYDGRLGPHPRSLAMAGGKALLVGQDVHKEKHFSQLFIETAGVDALAEILSGRYDITFGDRRWPPAAIPSGFFAGLAQRCRTRILKHALAAYRRTRSLLGRN